MQPSVRPDYHTDCVMKTLYRSLSEDLRRCLRLDVVTRNESATYHNDFRGRPFMLHDNLTGYQYKWLSQLNSLLKRYVFKDELITPDEREFLTNQKFIRLQERLAGHYQRPRSLRAFLVMQRARKICISIVGRTEPDGLFDGGRFGTKATVGCPKLDGYIDVKLSDKPITGSIVHHRWFQHYLANDPLLARIVSQNKSGSQVVECLSQVNVPKKYNIDRGINPNTLIGSLHSDCIGKFLVEKLKSVNLDIRRLQRRHGQYAKSASIYGHGVTADLSNASHAFLSSTLNTLMPRWLYRRCMEGVIRQVDVSGKVYRLESIMTMGIGFTFPAQTLLFYCLLCAIADLTGIPGKISVYGDDLFYPRHLHPYVCGIFSDLGFELNLDKTFVKSPFRESCGSDYFKGVDVRPFSPEQVGSAMSKTQYLAFLYKLINGLRHRWEDCEIQCSLNHLLFEVCRVNKEVFVVPPDMPDTAGFKTKGCSFRIEREAFPWYFPCAPIVAKHSPNSCYVDEFSFLQSSTRKRFVINHSPYYWDWLRISHLRRDPLVEGLPDTGLQPMFVWKKLPQKGSKRGKWARARYQATVTMRESVERYRIITPMTATRGRGVVPA